MIEGKMSIKIKPLDKTYLNEIMAIEAKAYGDHHWSMESFYNELSNDLAHYFAAVNEDDELIGYAGCWIIFEEAHMTNIAVDLNYHRKGVGEALLNAIVQECYEQMVKYITLEVRESNISAITLYEKYGFKSLGIRKGYYQNNNENALIMWTENIFYDKFKNLYSENVENLEKRIDIKWQRKTEEK
ncbi:MAG: ribosomal protein S18-alanine N-acetyltransferase [Candidatus Gastranaerophilales bacterium]